MTVKESTEYDNFLGKKTELPKEPTLSEFLGEDTEHGGDMNMADKEALWVGMPEFEQKDKNNYKTIYVHFRTKEDYEDFAKVIGQKLTPKTKSIWHPELDRTANHLLRWIEEE